MEKVSYRLLVIDDSKFIRSILQKALSSIQACDIKVVEADNGKEGLEILQKEKFDMVITDMEMPRVSGMELIEKIRSQKQFENLPILLLTGSADENVKIQAFEKGVTDYLTKPFLVPELEARTLGYLERYRAFQVMVEEIEARKVAEEALMASYNTVKSQREQMQQELEQAKETQSILMPEKLPTIPGTILANQYVPMDEIGGDFYDIFQIDAMNYGLLIADVTGHGISAALISFMISTVFHTSLQGTDKPDEVLHRTNEVLEDKLPNGKFATIFFGIYQIETKEFRFACGSHPPPLVVRPSTKEIFELSAKGQMVGILPASIVNYEEGKFQLEEGDKLLLYTDAIIEAENLEQTMLGIEGLKKLLIAHANENVTDLVNYLYEYGLDYSNSHKYADDNTFIALEILSQTS